MRTAGSCRTVDREISRFPRKERLHMPGSLTTPGHPGARDDAPGCVAFHHMHGVGTQDRTLSRLNGWPMRSPVNASPRSSRATAHDSGPMWIAIPSSQGTCTLYSSPVSRRFAYLVRSCPRKRTSESTCRVVVFVPSGDIRIAANFGNNAHLENRGADKKAAATSNQCKPSRFPEQLISTASAHTP